jgi:hypothetical protein
MEMFTANYFEDANSIRLSDPNETQQMQYRVAKTAVILDEMDAVFVEGCARCDVPKNVENSENYKEHCRLQP